jgi:copper ion binding protein
MEWDSRAVAEFIRMPLAKSAKENAKVQTEKYARKNKSDRVTLKEIEQTKKVIFGDVPEAARQKEMDKRVAEGEKDLREKVEKEGREILARDIELFNVEMCHAQYFRCRSQIIDVREAKREVEKKLRELKVSEMVADMLPDDERIMAHHRFTVSISGCPNACTAPEVRLFGVHGISKPMITDAKCSECWACFERCRRGAIVIRDGSPRINTHLCDMCENCVKVCPTGKLVSEKKGYRIMVGGKFGRFHQVGYEVYKIADKEQLMAAIEAAVQTIREEAVGEESLTSIINRVGVMPIFKKLLQKDGKMGKKATLNVSGMTCMHCVDRVTKALKKVPGVADARVSLEKAQAEVEFDPAKAGVAELEKAVEAAGYKVVKAAAPKLAGGGESCCG